MCLIQCSASVDFEAAGKGATQVSTIDLPAAALKPGGGQVASERLIDNHARMLGQVRGTESVEHHLKERGRDGAVVRRALSNFSCPILASPIAKAAEWLRGREWNSQLTTFCPSSPSCLLPFFQAFWAPSFCRLSWPASYLS